MGRFRLVLQLQKPQHRRGSPNDKGTDARTPVALNVGAHTRILRDGQGNAVKVVKVSLDKPRTM